MSFCLPYWGIFEEGSEMEGGNIPTAELFRATISTEPNCAFCDTSMKFCTRLV